MFPGLPFKENEIYSGSIHNNGRDIWFGTESGSIYKYDGRFNLVAKNKNFYGAKIRILKDECWLAKKGSLIQIDADGKEQIKISILDKEVWDFGLNAEGEIWVAFHKDGMLNHQIQIISKTQEENRIIEFYDDRWKENVFNLQYFIDENGDDQFLFSGRKILKLFDKHGKVIKDFAPKILEESPNFISQILFRDKEKNLWLNAYNKLLFVSPQKKLFKKYFANSLFSIRGITEINDEELFVATYKGFYLLNKLTGEKQKIESRLDYDYGLGVTKVGNEIL